ncbi:MAG: prepilin-type N-terminal cleavage/methylation domain-containing protein, partial [Planctomycetales bacterium]|nr:prepilin-type N-terminal cleavage/methylation domain-containing protein [Planctomycetales bacterium]
MIATQAQSRRSDIGCRPSFTLVELLIVLAILSVLASAVLVAAWGAQEDARAARTRAQIVKLHELIMNRWESYRTRPVPIRIPPTAVAGQAASVRLAALRQMMRRELPERI